MRTGTKMLMLSKNREMRPDGREMRSEGMDMRGGHGEMRMGYGAAQSNYGATNTYPRQEYGGEMNYRMDGNYEMENRRRFPRHRDGTFAPRSEYDGEETRGAYPPPVYEGGESGMNPIGFVPNGYTTYATHQRGNDMEHRNSQMERGGAYGKTTKLSRDMAEEWMEGLMNEDGSKGPHWSMEQTKQVMAQRGIKGDPIEFYAVMNALYSDYCKVFQKHNINKVDLYADLTNAWINDKDAQDGKAALYFECIAQK